MLTMRVRKSVMDKFRNICKRERLSQADCFEVMLETQLRDLSGENEFKLGIDR